MQNPYFRNNHTRKKCEPQMHTQDNFNTNMKNARMPNMKNRNNGLSNFKGEDTISQLNQKHLLKHLPVVEEQY